MVGCSTSILTYFLFLKAEVFYTDNIRKVKKNKSFICNYIRIKHIQYMKLHLSFQDDIDEGRIFL